ncbi:hypothetical protein BURPS305_3682 [Burkholderia pseudomallei 305]|nr:hypothetical protein BURPS305_3682 [Burkholderia pseudomallei 305]
MSLTGDGHGRTGAQQYANPNCLELSFARVSAAMSRASAAASGAFYAEICRSADDA